MVSITPLRVAVCAEFPNNIHVVHGGAIWWWEEPLGHASCQPAGGEGSDSCAERHDATDPDELAGIIEVVDELAFETVDEPPFVAEPPLSWRIDGAEVPRWHEREQEPCIHDAFVTFAAVLSRVALECGANAGDAELVKALLGIKRMEEYLPGADCTEALVAGRIAILAPPGLVRTPQFTDEVLSWQRLLRGESDDFAACGTSTLDEWAANLVARATGDVTRTQAIRRELRRYGIAAFGLVTEAA
ncbi:MAG: hypothetical protein ABSF69_22030 [Polyangiaceae bacterium]